MGGRAEETIRGAVAHGANAPRGEEIGDDNNVAREGIDITGRVVCATDAAGASDEVVTAALVPAPGRRGMPLRADPSGSDTPGIPRELPEEENRTNKLSGAAGDHEL